MRWPECHLDLCAPLNRVGASRLTPTSSTPARQDSLVEKSTSSGCFSVRALPSPALRSPRRMPAAESAGAGDRTQDQGPDCREAEVVFSAKGGPMKLACVGVLGLMLLGGSTFADCPGQVSGPHTLLSVERRGCCSHHGGVCGCDKGRALCCDGRLSPSCGCD